MNKVEKYYTEDYCEQNRLGEGCDNRHKVEIINKSFLLENEICKRAFDTYRVLDLGAGTGFWTDFILSFNISTDNEYSVLALSNKRYV